jgi:hypothetical protein
VLLHKESKAGRSRQIADPFAPKPLQACGFCVGFFRYPPLWG